ncbi:unnamed protein product [Staurois parvus]|uniref:Uncharacterized protein n=1 Tax=Staurois parvus TaxID=386267 RepID=A0ABN9BW96_9NEOB|nr:unnamed protein product [Staurois parvus]
MCGLPMSGPRRRAAAHLCSIKKGHMCREHAPCTLSQHTCPVLTERSRSPLSIGTFLDHVTVVTAHHGGHMTLNPAPPPGFWNP